LHSTLSTSSAQSSELETSSPLSKAFPVLLYYSTCLHTRDRKKTRIIVANTQWPVVCSSYRFSTLQVSPAIPRLVGFFEASSSFPTVRKTHPLSFSRPCLSLHTPGPASAWFWVGSRSYRRERTFQSRFCNATTWKAIYIVSKLIMPCLSSDNRQSQTSWVVEDTGDYDRQSYGFEACHDIVWVFNFRGLSARSVLREADRSICFSCILSVAFTDRISTASPKEKKMEHRETSACIFQGRLGCATTWRQSHGFELHRTSPCLIFSRS
jgi:hypothetical protein